jgi:hypothetical protein
VSTRLTVSAVPLGGMVLLQVDDRWHLVVTAAGASKIADMLHRAAHGTPMAGTVTDLHREPADPCVLAVDVVNGVTCTVSNPIHRARLHGGRGDGG